jgi:hypothetical protein
MQALDDGRRMMGQVASSADSEWCRPREDLTQQTLNSDNPLDMALCQRPGGWAFSSNHKVSDVCRGRSDVVSLALTVTEATHE